MTPAGEKVIPIDFQSPQVMLPTKSWIGTLGEGGAWLHTRRLLAPRAPDSKGPTSGRFRHLFAQDLHVCASHSKVCVSRHAVAPAPCALIPPLRIWRGYPCKGGREARRNPHPHVLHLSSLDAERPKRRTGKIPRSAVLPAKFPSSRTSANPIPAHIQKQNILKLDE